MVRWSLGAVAWTVGVVFCVGCAAAGGGTDGGGAATTDTVSGETATSADSSTTTDTAATGDATGQTDAAVTDNAAGPETLTDATKDTAVVPDTLPDIAPDVATTDVPPDSKPDLPPTGCTCADVNCGPGAVCVPKAGECKKNAELKTGQCWADANCPTGVPCTGAFVCPCNADCNGPDQPGVCGKPPACSCATIKCAAGSVCVPEGATCKSNALLKAGECWTDANCADGKPCVGVSVCPCDADCGVPDKPGLCGGTKPACNCNGNTCAADQVCLPEPNVCVSPLKPGQCWADKDCAGGGSCQGAFVCPCNGKCPKMTTPGTCGGTAPICTCEGKPCGAGQLCVPDKKVCVDPNNLPAGQCWTDAQCPGGKCEGANICPCGAACFAADKPGTCDKPPQVACKCGGKPCGADQVCAGDGVCKNSGELKAGQCWSSANCGLGQTCDGANICPCGAMCLVADKPGTCSGGGGGGPVCQKVDPFGFGMCEMVLGVVFDGAKCVYASGCGCADKCALIFKDMAACQLACGLK